MIFAQLSSEGQWSSFQLDLKNCAFHITANSPRCKLRCRSLEEIYLGGGVEKEGKMLVLGQTLITTLQCQCDYFSYVASSLSLSTVTGVRLGTVPDLSLILRQPLAFPNPSCL
jgi:hypothetical protein